MRVLSSLAILALAANWLAQRKLTRVIEFEVTPIAVPTDAAAIERGKYLYDSRGCMECHGSDGAGRDVINDPHGMYVHSPNISPGPGSVTKGYADVDWVRAIRYGISPQRHALFLMPSKDYSRLTDADLGSIIAYARTLPPSLGEGAVIRLPFVVKALYATGAVKDDAEQIDRTLPPPAPVAETISAEHGVYVAQMCTGCHGDGLSGGKIPGSPPDWPPAANLTPGTGSAMGRYPSEAAFASMLRTGKRPDGTPVSRVMPFTTLGNLNDTDIGAVYVYLKSLPARPAGNR